MADSIVAGDALMDLAAIKVAMDAYETKHDLLFRIHDGLFADPNRTDIPHNELDKLNDAGAKLQRMLNRHSETYLALVEASKADNGDNYRICLGAYCRVRENLKATFNATLLASCAAIAGFSAYAYELMEHEGNVLPVEQALEHRSLTEYFLAVSRLSEEFKDLPQYRREPDIKHLSKVIGGFILLLIIVTAMVHGPNYFHLH